jgi:hypothetical protein
MSSILSQFMQTPEYINTKDSVQAGRLKFAQFARDFLATNGIPEGVGESAAMSYYTEQMS